MAAVRTRAYPLEEYGPLPALLTTGPLRPVHVHRAQGVQVDGGSSQRLLVQLPNAGLGPAVTVSGWARVKTAAGSQTRGIAELAAGSTVLSLRYTSTQVIATDGTNTAAVALPVAAGDVLFAAASVGPAGLRVFAQKTGGTQASATTASPTSAPAYTTLDVGFAQGQSRADAALVDVLAWRAQLTDADLLSLAAGPGVRDLYEDPRIAVAALSPGCPDLTVSLSVDGAGLWRPTRQIAQVVAEPPRPDAATPYPDAQLVLTIPTPSNLTAGTGRRLLLDDGTVSDVLAVVPGPVLDDVYLRLAAPEQRITGGLNALVSSTV